VTLLIEGRGGRGKRGKPRLVTLLIEGRGGRGKRGKPRLVLVHTSFGLLTHNFFGELGLSSDSVFPSPRLSSRELGKPMHDSET
jgi:hypothetical protein